MTRDSYTLDELRRKIDEIDSQLLSLINERVRLASEIGIHKNRQGDAPYYVPSREAEIIRRLLDRNEGVISDASIHGIFREIIGACLAREHAFSVAYLGPEGTFTYAAARRQFGSSASLQSCKSFEEVFDEVEAGRTSYGVVPVENAFEGAVTHTLDLFMDCNVSICAEILLGIEHHLLTHAKRLADVTVVYSRPEILAQCRLWLQRYLPGVRLREAESSAAAAEQVAELGGNTAAIASREMAARLGMNILKENIEDHHGNTTRFLVIGQHDSSPSGEDKTAVLMSSPNRPGALHGLLEPFSGRGIGLSRIESRPSKKKLWEYVFFVDLIGHREEASVSEALDEIRGLPGAWLKVLGSYPVSRQL